MYFCIFYETDIFKTLLLPQSLVHSNGTLRVLPGSIHTIAVGKLKFECLNNFIAKM